MSNSAIPQADALTLALRRAVERDKALSLTAGDYALEVMLVALGCNEPPDATCLDRIGNRVGAEQYVWGRLELDGEEVVADLHLWSKGEPGAEMHLRYSKQLTDPDDDVLQAIADRVREKLIGKPKGLLVLSYKAKTGSVYLDGKPAGSLNNGTAELSVTAGAHQVRVRAPGYREAVGPVTVPAGGRAELELHASPLPVGGEEGQDKVESNRAVTSHAPVAGYALIGVGAALLGGGIYALLRVNAINHDDGYQRYRDGLGPGQDVCVEAERGTEIDGAPSSSSIRSQCSTGQVLNTAQYLLFGLAAMSVAGGTYLVLSDDSGSAHSARALRRRARRLEPRLNVSQSRAEVGLGVAF